MGGTLVKGRGSPLTASFEFNFCMDRQAAGAVLGAPCEKVLFTSELCRQAIFTRRDLEALRSMPGEVAGVPRQAHYSMADVQPVRVHASCGRVRALGRSGRGVPPRAQSSSTTSTKKRLRLRSVSRGGGGLEPDPVPGAEAVRLPGRILDPGALIAEFLQAIEKFGKSRVHRQRVDRIPRRARMKGDTMESNVVEKSCRTSRCWASASRPRWRPSPRTSARAYGEIFGHIGKVGACLPGLRWRSISIWT